MPTKVNVRVNTIQHTTQQSQAGNTLNYIEITGFNETDNKGFKKRFFSTKKDGTATKNAETADSLNKDDWIEIVLDDTSYHNVQTLKKIAAPANASAPSQAGQPVGVGTVAGNKMSKGDWAAKDKAKNASIARSVALKAAVDFLNPAENGPQDVIDMAVEFEGYLLNGRRSPGDEAVTKETAPNGNTITTPVEDDDIPF